MRLHGLPPVIDARTRVMVLGSFPGAASLAAQQYYAHPRNQFWPLLGGVLGVDLPALPYAQRLAALLAHGIGLWDVYASCERVGSLDAAIRAPQVQDFAPLRAQAPHWVAALHNGQASARLAPQLTALGLATAVLPSTSPAHAARTLADKQAAWRAALAPHGVGAGIMHAG